MTSRRGGLILIILSFCFGVGVSRPVSAAGTENAEAYLQRAKTAFALGRHAEAADNYEKAFELKPDPAVLYNAAQAYRLAGNKQHALTLYENYLRVYGVEEKRAEVDAHIDALKQAIAHDAAVANSPPTGTEPVGGEAAASPAPAPASPIASPTPTPTAPAPVEPAASSPMLVSQPSGAAAEDNRPITKKPWFWAVVGGGVAAAVVIGILVATAGSKDPTASIGKVSGQ